MYMYKYIQAEEEEIISAQKVHMIDEWPCDSFTVSDCTDNYPVCVY